MKPETESGNEFLSITRKDYGNLLRQVMELSLKNARLQAQMQHMQKELELLNKLRQEKKI